MGKGEIARYEQFLLFPQCFQKACFPGASKGVIVWEWFKLFEKILTWKKSKYSEIAFFSFFPQCLLPYQRQAASFKVHTIQNGSF